MDCMVGRTGECAIFLQTPTRAALCRIARQQITRIGHLAQLRGGNITRAHAPNPSAVSQLTHCSVVNLISPSP